ncbi:MAG: hypothetical protein HYT22_03545 [Candidatus Niyogibacteria bacterium]|nr:hypothetical protein [Candidatus Niyogibacteria bacterium]
MSYRIRKLALAPDPPQETMDAAKKGLEEATKFCAERKALQERQQHRFEQACRIFGCEHSFLPPTRPRSRTLIRPEFGNGGGENMRKHRRRERIFCREHKGLKGGLPKGLYRQVKNDPMLRVVVE